MGEIQIADFERLEEHLQMILKNPDTCLDEKLIDEVRLQLTGMSLYTNSGAPGLEFYGGMLIAAEGDMPIVIPRLLPLLTKILPSYPKNPGILSELTEKLLRSLEFTQVLAVAPEESLLLALQSPFSAAILLGISIISKASLAPSHTAILSNMKPLVHTFIQVWLSSPDVAVGEAATQTLGDLLEMDCDCRKTLSPCLMSRVKDLNIGSNLPLGQGLLWRRIFQDQDIYKLLFSLCDLSSCEKDEFRLDRRQISIAQGRLLQLLPRLATLNFQIISQSQFPMIEKIHIGRPSGILYFAATKMIDKEDLLINMILITFFGHLLSVISKETLSSSNFAFLNTIVNEVASENITLKQSIEATVENPETTPELQELLSRLINIQR
ncbi:hypothetical protein EPUL_000611 [Erysiphe pulchra]|uniref:DNA mismatch repair protein HSM3 N-terminal domain-containing protein n=1 Tax=Erysiphe pulchra TaxID=225359 RepID=A0A2S4Q1U7_9PEZI|nr:hypothetical protein EPUL_000611 [Erysiphe pulchra]